MDVAPVARRAPRAPPPGWSCCCRPGPSGSRLANGAVAVAEACCDARLACHRLGRPAGPACRRPRAPASRAAPGERRSPTRVRSECPMNRSMPASSATAAATTTTPQHRAARAADEPREREPRVEKDRGHGVSPSLTLPPASSSGALGARGDVRVVRGDRPARSRARREAPRSCRAPASPVSESRWPVGSSQSSSSGRCASARAMATRCDSPPDSSAGRESALCGGRPGPAAPPAPRRDAASAAATPPGPRRRRSPTPSGSEAGSTPGRRRRSPALGPARERRRRASTGARPSSAPFPTLGTSSPPRTWRSVVLPDPERPEQRQMLVRRAISRSTSRERLDPGLAAAVDHAHRRRSRRARRAGGDGRRSFLHPSVADRDHAIAGAGDALGVRDDDDRAARSGRAARAAPRARSPRFSRRARRSARRRGPGGARRAAAAAIATRCCSPPESARRAQVLRARPSPNAASASRRPSLRRRGARRVAARWRRSPRAESAGHRLSDWKTIATWRAR